MADQYSNEGSSSSNAPGEGSVSTVELNIKTLDSQIYTFQVEKNMQVQLFKEKIASKIGVPVGQQRLIFRGKVLKDDHPLSEYHVENGHTLHLVERQPTQPQPSSGTGSGGTSENNGNRGNDASTGAPRNRVGQISHSVVLGTFNVGEQGEGIVPDLSRVIGAVLNSIGVGGQPNATTGTQASNLPNASGQSSQGNETDGTRGNVGGQNHVGNQPQSGQGAQLFQSFAQALPIPLAPTIPSVNAPIPDSLNTLSEFMNSMEQSLSQNGYQPHSSSANTGDRPRVELPSNARGMATPEALAIVLRHAERLLSGQAISALSHIAGRLEQEGASTDPTTRGQIQTESVRVGLAMQHFGALLLELGRTILTLRMGQSPAESVVNSGPAVYISPSGPNPIMVQPFPLQTSSLFGGSAAPNHMPFGPVATGNPPRHVNIHIHAGTALAPMLSAAGARTSNGEGMQAGRSNTVVPGAAAVPLRPTGPVVSNAANPDPPSSDSNSSSEASMNSRVAAINSWIRDMANNTQGQSQSTVQNSSGCIPEGQKLGGCSSNPRDVAGGSLSSGGENTASSSKKRDIAEGDKALPLGLGLSLERKKRGKQDKPLVKSGDGGTASTSLDQTQESRDGAQQVLEALAAFGPVRNRTNASDPPSRQVESRDGAQQVLEALAAFGPVGNRTNASDPPSRQVEAMDGRPLAGQNSNGQLGTVMSQVLNSPALDGLLGGVSEQTGVGSPNVLRNMLQQFTQSPQMMNTVSQIAQQVDSQGIENMLGGMGRGQAGGLDLSGMIQQMMPIVSRAFGGGAASSLPSFPAESLQNNHGIVEPGDQNAQPSSLVIVKRGFQVAKSALKINLEDVVQTIENQNPPEDIFRAIAQSAVGLSGNEFDMEDLLDEMRNNEGLASEYIEMLQRDLKNQPRGAFERN